MDVELGGNRREAVNTTIFLNGFIFFEAGKISADIYLLHATWQSLRGVPFSD